MFIAVLFTPKHHKYLSTDEQVNKFGTSTPWHTYSKMMNTIHEFQMYNQEKKDNCNTLPTKWNIA